MLKKLRSRVVWSLARGLHGMAEKGRGKMQGHADLALAAKTLPTLPYLELHLWEVVVPVGADWVNCPPGPSWLSLKCPN